MNPISRPGAYNAQAPLFAGKTTERIAKGLVGLGIATMAGGLLASLEPGLEASKADRAYIDCIWDKVPDDNTKTEDNKSTSDYLAEGRVACREHAEKFDKAETEAALKGGISLLGLPFIWAGDKLKKRGAKKNQKAQ